jgi:putative effector of murein hydrolase
MGGTNLALQHYRTSVPYINYFFAWKGLPSPGAGDVLTAILDVSIVALAIPMFNFRSELFYNVLPSLPSVSCSLFRSWSQRYSSQWHLYSSTQ